jgi:hypothetical protein
MQFRNLINIKLDHAYFNGERKFQFGMTIPGTSAKLANSYGILPRLKDNLLHLYSLDNFEADDMEDAGPFWIHLNFLDSLTPNYTGIDYLKDKEILLAGFGSEANSAETPFEVKNTLNKLVDLCRTHGVEACEPEKLILPDSTIWENTLASLLSRIEEGIIDPGLITLEGGAAEGAYLFIINDEWSYPDAVFRIDPSCFKMASESSSPLEFTVAIPSREVYWCYYIIQRSDVELTNVSISSEKKSEDDATPLPQFGQSESVTFQDLNQGRALKIVSESPCALKNRYPFSITLNSQSMSGDPLMLPYPGVNVLSSIERSGKVELCSESYIYL